MLQRWVDHNNVEHRVRDKYELKLVLEESTGAVKLESQPPCNTMWGKYWYRSGINKTMVNELKDIVESVQKIVKLKEGDNWLDIACNDGTLLSFVSEKYNRYGVDPADDSFKQESSKHGTIYQDYFSNYSASRNDFKLLHFATVIDTMLLSDPI